MIYDIEKCLHMPILSYLYYIGLFHESNLSFQSLPKVVACLQVRSNGLHIYFMLLYYCYFITVASVRKLNFCNHVKGKFEILVMLLSSRVSLYA